MDSSVSVEVEVDGCIALGSVDDVLRAGEDSAWTGLSEKISREMLAGRSHKDITYWKP